MTLSPLESAVRTTSAGILAALVAAGGALGAIKAGTETVTSGQVTATLAWDGGEFGPRNTQLTITRAGVTAFEAKIPAVVCNEGCLIQGKGDVVIRDLDGDGEGEVVVTGFTGGAHCCSLMAVYDFRPLSGHYGRILRNFYSEGFALKDLDNDGRVEIRTGDVRFEDLFTSHAASFTPLQILRYARPGGAPRLKDVTRQFPKPIRQNAAEAKKLFAQFKSGIADTEIAGVLSAYVADQYLLGHGAIGVAEIDRQIKRGVLGPPKPAGQLKRRILGYLRRYGYR